MTKMQNFSESLSNMNYQGPYQYENIHLDMRNIGVFEKTSNEFWKRTLLISHL